MLRSLKDLERYRVSAVDGDVGSVVNFFVDDRRWVVRYLVVNTGHFLEDRRVLVSPIFFREAEWSSRRFHVAMTTDKIRRSPNVDTDKPVSRQHERDYYNYYGYPYYWGSSSLWGMGNLPGLLGPWDQPPTHADDPSDDAHLRSVNEVCGYDVEGSDGGLGSVADFIIDEETWAVRYLVVDTSHWWFGRKVLVAPGWASRVDWDERKVHVELSRQAIKDSPTWSSTDGVNRQYETHLYDYYGRPAYWSDGDRPKEGEAQHQSAHHPG